MQSIQSSQDRLTHVQLLFTWNPSHLSLQSCYTNKCYFHQDLRHKKFRAGFRGVHLIIYLGTPPTNYTHSCNIMAWYRQHDVAPSIFGVTPFGRWVITHSLADFDFHDHRPAVKMKQHPLWYLINMRLSAYPAVRFIPRRQFCLPKRAHLGYRIYPTIH